MQKLSCLLVLVVIFSSCSSPDEEPILTPNLTAGATEQANVSYHMIGKNYLFSDVEKANDLLVSTVAIDLDEDGVEDLSFELSSSIQTDLQVLMVKPLNGLQLPQSPKDHQAQLVKSGEVISPFGMDWQADDWLLVYYQEDDQSWPEGTVKSEPGYLPLLLQDRTAWLEIQLLMDARQETVWGINLKQLAVKAS